MERVKVLAAALALREFTVDEVAALSGVGPNSVRSVLNRSPGLVHRIGAEQGTRRGRPATRWAITDSATTRKLGADLDALASAEVRQSPLSPDDQREVAVSVAEEALSQVVNEDDPDIRREIFSSARASLQIAAGAEEKQGSHLNGERWWLQDSISSFAVRARGVDALATLAVTSRAELSRELLTRTALDVAAAMAATPDSGDAAYFAPMSQILASRGSFAPLLALCSYEPPANVSDDWTELPSNGLDFDVGRVLTQSWAEPLVRVSTSMPMLLTSIDLGLMGGDLVKLLLAKTRAIPRPTLVFGDLGQSDLMHLSVRAGASFVPVDWESSGERQFAIDAVAAAIDRHAAR